MANYPTSLDSLTRPTSSDTLASAGHRAMHTAVAEALEALEARVGITGSLVATSHEKRLADAEASLTATRALEHAHSNKTLLDSYDQTNANLTDAVSKKHTHANSAVLDTVTSDVVSQTHTHANKATLDTYDQTNANLTDAVSKKHSHANSTALDAVSGVNSGDQDLSGYSLTTHNHDSAYEAKNANIQSHISSTSNPHSVTAAQVLPTQTGQGGKYLTTNGTTTSWGTVVAGGGGDFLVMQVFS